MRSVTAATWAISATSCTRTMCAPARMLAATVAAVAKTRSSAGTGLSLRSVAERLAIATGDSFVRTAYKYTADAKPTFIATSWEPLGLAGDGAGGSTGASAAQTPEGGPFGGWGIIRRLAEVGITVTRAVEEIVPRTLTGPEAETLGLRAGIAIIVIERTHFAGDKPVETADMVIPPPYRPRYEIPVEMAEDGDEMGVA